jgi:apolipoprotein D and lipocalin family protein
MKRLCIVFCVCLLACSAHAGAPAPARAVPSSLYSGRWYEIARTPNAGEHDCAAPTSDFSGFLAGAFSVIQTCHTAKGGVHVIRSKAQLLAGSQNTRFRMSFLGGLVHQEYWILDTAPDGAWAIMATPGGHYVWLLARQPALPPAERAAAFARISALGYATDRLTLAGTPPA